MAKQCTQTSNAHADAWAVIEFVIDHNGTVDLPQDEIARKLDMVKRRAGGFDIDKSRYKRAVNHAMDCVDGKGQPCCGYRLHYRRSGGGTLSIIEHGRGYGDYAKHAIGAVLGWASRERQHRTENERRIEQVQALADEVFANSDQYGHKLLTRVEYALSETGTIPDALMVELETWLASIS